MVAGVAAVTSMMAATAVSASAAPVTSLQQSWGTNGRVRAIVADPGSGRVYVAGDFSAVTDGSGSTTLPIANVAAFLPASGTFDPEWHPNPNGLVTSLALSGGDVYMGGDFTQVDGQARVDLAAVDAITGAAESWAPRVTGGQVAAIGVGGDSMYVGGNFTGLAGGARSYLGRVGLSDGKLDTGWTPTLNARVRTLVVAESLVYIGGDFGTVNGSATGKSIASLSTGSLATLTTGFNAGPTNAGGEPTAFDLYLDGTYLLAAVGGSGGGCAALDATTGSTRWSKHTNGNVQAVTSMGGTVYCGGHFGGLGSFDGNTRFKIAAVTEATGAVEAFAPRINSPLGVWALDHDAANLYVGGEFTKVSGQLQPHFAVFS